MARNSVIPTVLFVFVTASLLVYTSGFKILRKISLITLIAVTFLEQIRFADKFLSFSETSWLYPETETINLIRKEEGYARIMSLDRQIIPPNFSSGLKILDVSGYDPLYLKDYGLLAASWNSDRPEYELPAFGRIITPQRHDSFIADLLGVKYVLSLTPVESGKMKPVHTEGKTYLYENTYAFPRVFLAEGAVYEKDYNRQLETVFKLRGELRKKAVISEDYKIEESPLEPGEFARILEYGENKVEVEANCEKERILVLTDPFYPSWSATVNGKDAEIIRTDFFLRGVRLLPGKSNIIFRTKLF